MSEGLDKLQSLRAGGFSDQEVAAWQADRSRALLDGGFSQEDVAKYWGEKSFDTSALKQHFEKNLAAVKTEPGKDLSFMDYVDAGWQMSVSGLIKRQKMPDTILPTDVPLWGSIASKVAQIGGDLPAMLAGAWVGAEGGAAVGAPTGAAIGVLGGPSAPVTVPAGAALGATTGAVLGGGYGAMALPAYIRRTLVDAYSKGQVKDFHDFWGRAAGAFIDAHNAGMVGAVTAGAGGVVTAAAAPVMSPIAAKALNLGAQVTTMTIAGKAMEGQVPTARDFLEGAILMGGMTAAGYGADLVKSQSLRVAQKIGETYAQTGIRPDEVANDARLEPTIRQDILSDNIDVPAKYASVADQTGAEVKAPVSVSDAMRTTSEAVKGFEQPANDVVVPKAEQPPEETPKVELPVLTEDQMSAQQKVLSRISMEDQPPPKGMTLDKMYTALVDDLHPLKQLTKLLTGEKPLEVKDDPYQLARLTRGSTGKADTFLEFGPRNFDTLQPVQGAKALTKILEPVREDLDGLRAYAVAKRSLELNARGIETGVPLEAAKQTVAEGKSFEPVFRDLKQYQTHTLQYLRDSGLLSEEAFGKMRDANQDYVPFYRLMDEGGGAPGSAGKGLSVRAPVKKIAGSQRQIVDPLESIIKNTYLYVQLAERNRALTALADLAESAGDAGAQMMERVPTPMRPVTISEPEVARFMKENGIDGNADAMTVFRPRLQALANDEIALYRDGNREIYKVSPDVATAVRALDRESVNLAIKIMAAPARALRAGTTLSPEFTVRNFIRDQNTAFILNQKGYIPIYDALRGMGSLFKKDEDYQNWLFSGGANSAVVSIDREYIEQKVFKLEGETGLMSKSWNVVKSPLEMLRVASEVIENASRIGAYKRATKGESDAGAIFEGGMSSRDVTLDFQRVGAKMRAANMIVAFLNPGVQGLDKTYQAFRDNPGASSFKAAVAITAPSVLLWYANKDDSRWKEVPRWQKDMFWIMFTDDHIFRIPKPPVLGQLFGSIPERALELYAADNPKAFKDLSDTMFQAVTPNYIPTFALPVIEQFANKSTFTGNPIVPSSMEGILPEYQYTDYTTESGKLLGKFAATLPGMRDSSLSSPAVIENYIRAWSGQLGMYALKIADQALIKSGAVPDPVRPVSTLADIPVVKAFVIRYPGSSAQSIQDFYDSYDKTQTRLNTIKYLAKAGDLQAAMDVMKLAQSEQDMISLTGVKNALSTQNKFLRMVAKNPDITPSEKRQIIDSAYYGMIASAKQGNEMLDAMNRQIESRGVAIRMPPSTTPATPQERSPPVFGGGPRIPETIH